MIAIDGNIVRVLEDYPACESLVDLAPRCYRQLPSGAKFEDDSWDIIGWKKRKGNARYFNVDFSDFKNVELKELTKVFILHKG